MNKTRIAGIALASVMGLAASGIAFAQTTNMTMDDTTSVHSNFGIGSHGDEVRALQEFLEAKGFLTLPGNSTKGYFGGITKRALAEYQASVGLPATGFFGNLTRAHWVEKKGGMMSSSSTVPMSNTKAADLRVVLNALEREHVDLASSAVRAGFDGHASFAASAGQLDQNSIEISKAVGSVYGAAAEARFLEIWRSHIGFFVDYTTAAKKGDKAGMDKAVQNLNGYVDAISDFFSQANPNLPREAVHQLVGQHVLLLKAAVDTYGAGDFAGSYKNQHAANVQIGSIADATAGAIVKQYPEKF